MIFVTVGSMFPFDRLIAAMDQWAAGLGQSRGEVLAQIGAGSLEPCHMRWVRRLERAEFARTVAGADLVVAHAGMGSVITAGEYGKPIVLLPRRAAAGEHTNDHQIDTAGWLRRRPGIYVADAEQISAPASPRPWPAAPRARASGPRPRRISSPGCAVSPSADPPLAYRCDPG